MKSILSKIAKPMAITLVAVMLTSILSGLASFHRLVYVTDGQYTRILYTQLEDPKEILAEAEIPMKKYDTFFYNEKRDSVYDLTIDRAYPVSVKADGKQLWAPMQGGSVSVALSRVGIKLGAEDVVTPALSESVNEGTVITVQRIEHRVRDEVSIIPFKTVYNKTNSLKTGETKVVTKGLNGEKVTTKKEYVVDGVIKESEIVKETTKKQPVNQVVLVGDKRAATSPLVAPASLTLDQNGNPTNYVKKITGKGTAYSARKGAKTASGRYAIVGHVAVNPKVIPYGSKLYIKSVDNSFVYGYAIAADTGTALMDGRVMVDLFFNTYQECCRFGAKKMEVYILE
ncbi:MAG: G5 domain-containing protein [Oscillospiraceae bacterium]